MASNINPQAWDIANEFARWATDQYHDFEEFITLYDYSEKRRQLLEETAKSFFSDLFWMYIDRIILNVSKLTDPRQIGGHQTFSIHSVHNYFKCCPGYRTKDAKTLISNINDKAKKVRTWRKKLVAHYDWHPAIGNKNVSDKFVRSDFEVLYNNLWKYVEMLFSSVFNSAYDIDAVSYYGATELVEALKESQALRDLKNRDINAYSNLRQNSVFKDA
jgi:hypothetical protein